MSQNALIPQKFFNGQMWLEDQAILIENGRVHSLLPKNELPHNIEKKKMKSHALVPAFIDIQIYGANKNFFAVNPTIETLRSMVSHCKKGGTTLFLPTIATCTLPVIYKCIDCIRSYWKKGGKGVFGMHLEGPWLSKLKKGAHVEELIHAPTVDEVKALLAHGRGVIKLITLAPEVCPDEVLDLIRAEEIIIAAGHSNANYEEAMSGFSKGVTTVTHFYNAMSALQHREPGLVGATFTHETVTASIIPDGHHVHFEAVAIAKKILGPRLFAITDAVTQTSSGNYELELDGDIYRRNGVLSGSALTMDKAFNNLVNHVHIEVEEALRMCSLYPAKTLKADHEYGRIAPGYMAHFTVLNEKLEIEGVLV